MEWLMLIAWIVEFVLIARLFRKGKMAYVQGKRAQYERQRREFQAAVDRAVDAALSERHEGRRK